MSSLGAASRETERRGRDFDFAGVDVDCGVEGVLGVCLLAAAVAGGARGVEERTVPAIDEYMCESWMCVPGPGRYFDADPSSVPGRAIGGRVEGAGIVAVFGVQRRRVYGE